MPVSRREFLISSSAMSALLLSNMSTAALSHENHNSKNKNSVNMNVRTEITASIQASFGSAFEIISHVEDGEYTLAKIEHLENQYIVASKDLSHWNIISSSVS